MTARTNTAIATALALVLLSAAILLLAVGVTVAQEAAYPDSTAVAPVTPGDRMADAEAELARGYALNEQQAGETSWWDTHGFGGFDLFWWLRK